MLAQLIPRLKAMNSDKRPPTLGELCSYDASGSYLGVSRSTIKLLAAQNRIVRVRIGRRTLFTRASLDALIKELQERPA